MSRFSRPTARKWLVIFGVVLGIIFTVFAANFVRSEKKVEHVVESPYGISDPQFARSMGSLLVSPLLGGNAVTELLNGDAIFPSMLEAIRGAQRTITFESFIYWSGDIGRKFADALSQRAQPG